MRIRKGIGIFIDDFARRTADTLAGVLQRDHFRPQITCSPPFPHQGVFTTFLVVKALGFSTQN